MRERINAEGILLRMERIRQRKEQKEICTGICAVSTLSKIETGKQKADPFILEKLYRELGIHYTSDESTVAMLREKVDKFYEQFSYQREQQIFRELKSKKEILWHSPLAADWMVICALMEEGEEWIPVLEACRDFLTRRQRGWYLLALSERMGQEGVENGREAAAILQNSISLVQLVHVLYTAGEYRLVLETADRAAMAALEEGNLWTLAESHNMKGTVYACFNMEEMMLKEYKIAANLLEESRWGEHLRNIYYNIGATYLGIGRYGEAEEYLKKAVPGDGSGLGGYMLHHKLALLWARTGKSDKAWEQVAVMEAWPCKSEMESRILQVTKMELEKRMGEDIFLEQLEQLMEYFHKRKMFGYMMFFHSLLQEQYKNRRMYRKAFLLEKRFSDIQRKTTF